MSKGVANFQRRTWDKTTYEKLALAREDQQRSIALPPPPSFSSEIDDDVKTSFGTLKRASADAAGPSGSSKAYLEESMTLRLDGKVGKVEKFQGGARNAGYECTVCDRVFPDSNSLLDHLNGREHLSRLGYSMKVAPSSKKEVKGRLQMHVETAATHGGMGVVETKIKGTLEERMRVIQAQQGKQNGGKKVKVEQQVIREEEVNEQSEELKKMLGFSSFG